LGLFAVGIGSVVNLLFFWILKNYVSDESGIAIRAAINIGSYFSILLCFGYDSASATEQNFEHFRRKIQVLFTFNLLGYIICLIGLIAQDFFLQSQNSIIPSWMMAISVAVGILYATTLRMKENFKSYFVTLNILDKVLRVAALVFFFRLTSNPLWFVAFFSGCLIVFYFWKFHKDGFRFQFELSLFLETVRKSQLFLFQPALLILLTRSSYLFAFFTQSNERIWSFDFLNMFSLIVLIPALNTNKIAEKKSAGNPFLLINQLTDNLFKNLALEILILTMISGLIPIGINLKILDNTTILADAFFMLSGMQLLIVLPNPLMICALIGDKSRFFVFLVAGSIGSAGVFFTSLAFLGRSPSLAFCLAAFFYFLFSFAFLRRFLVLKQVVLIIEKLIFFLILTYWFLKFASQIQI
jgi:hypothetical protein